MLTDLGGKDSQRDYVISENINTLKYTDVQQELNTFDHFFHVSFEIRYRRTRN